MLLSKQNIKTNMFKQLLTDVWFIYITCFVCVLYTFPDL